VKAAEACGLAKAYSEIGGEEISGEKQSKKMKNRRIEAKPKNWRQSGSSARALKQAPAAHSLKNEAAEKGNTVIVA